MMFYSNEKPICSKFPAQKFKAKTEKRDKNTIINNQ